MGILYLISFGVSLIIMAIPMFCFIGIILYIISTILLIKTVKNMNLPKRMLLIHGLSTTTIVSLLFSSLLADIISVILIVVEILAFIKYYNPYPCIEFDEELMKRVLDNLIETINAYSEILPNDYCALFIVPLTKLEKHESSLNNTYYTIECNLNFRLYFDVWWPDILQAYPGQSYILDSWFKFDPDTKMFKGLDFPVGVTVNKRFPLKRLVKILNKFLDEYEEKHPKIKFDRLEHGACLRRN